jgi:hypothetical protein
MSLTDEMVKDLARDIKVAEKQFKFWSKETPKNQFISDLNDMNIN